MTNLATLLTTSAQKYGSDPVVILDDLHMTYGQLDDLSARGAALLKANGIRPGDRVALVLPNVPHMAVLYYAVLRAGGIVVPLNPLLTPRELTYHFQDASVSFVLAWEDMAEASQRAAEEVEGLSVLPISATGSSRPRGSATATIASCPAPIARNLPANASARRAKAA